jgi:hypothetical protein
VTLDLALTRGRLKELRALDRVRRAIINSASDPDFLYALAALDARLDELRALLAREDPQLIRDAEQLLDTAHLTAPDETLPAMQPGHRVH